MDIMKNKIKEFKISTLSIKNTKTVFLLTLIILLGGVMAYNTMPKENFPELQIPEIYIGIAKPGSSPQFMAEKISKGKIFSSSICRNRIGSILFCLK